jgi:CSLREA domain-containing protein
MVPQLRARTPRHASPRRAATGALLAVLLCLALAGPASANTFRVNTTADTTVAGGCTTASACSLRDAVTAANAAPGSTINVPAGTFTLNTGGTTLGELRATTEMTIQGAGARRTIINGNDRSRIFTQESDADRLSIVDVTLTGGRTPAVDPPSGYNEDSPGDGGAVFANGPLSVTRSTVRDNGAQFGGGGLAGVFIFIAEGDGAPSPMTITDSTISDNVVEGGANQRGGGISNYNDVTLVNSTVANNHLTGADAAQGGGIAQALGLTSLRNSTVTGNTVDATDAEGGGISNFYDFVGEVTGVFGSIDATNSVVAENSTNGADNDCGLSSTNTSDHNIESGQTCDFGDQGSQQETDPRLGPLGNNGGPTDTRLPVPTSPAVNKANNAGCPSPDQRGVARAQQGRCDVGSVEYAPPYAFTGGVSSITSSSANLGGRATNPLVTAAVTLFQYGTTTAYGSSATAAARGAHPSAVASAQGVPPRTATQPISGQATGLSASTTYHYRAVAVNGDGFGVGSDATFTTKAPSASAARPSVAVGGVRSSCVRRAFTVRVRARVASSARLKAVRVTLDGRTLKRSKKGRFTVRVNAQRLRSGRHTLKIKAVDSANRSRTVTRRFTRCARPTAPPLGNPRFTG